MAPLGTVGEQTLELFRANDDYSRFLWECLERLSPRPVAGRLLEVGCGIGNLTRILLASPAVSFLHAMDVEPAYIKRVEAEVRDPRLRASVAAAEAFCPPEHRGEEGGFDAIVSSNVLEHIEDHARVLRNFRDMLRRDGVVLLLVPAHPFLFSSLDRHLLHFRRYSARGLRALAAATGLRVVRLRHFNPVGALGWWINGKLLGRAVLPAGQLSFYTRFAIPLSRLVDRLNPFPLGVSLLAALARSDGSVRSAEGESA